MKTVTLEFVGKRPEEAAKALYLQFLDGGLGDGILDAMEISGFDVDMSNWDNDTQVITFTVAK